MRHLWIALLIGAGCRSGDTDKPLDISDGEPSAEDPSTVEETVVGEADLEPSETAESRARMRMTIGQLQASMKHITGVDWMSGNKVLWEEYSTSLGVPDYQETVNEDLSANVIFQKFLQDASIYSCQEWIEHDGLEGPYAFFVDTYDEGNPATVSDNVRYLRKLVHGYFSETDDPMIQSLEDLYTLVYQRTQDPTMTWNTVCVALFTHPDFYTY